MKTFLTRMLAPLLLLTMLPALALSAPAQAATSRASDGLTPATAAASCWEIKQGNAASASGIYWLVTPQLQAPQQFYCDQTTDGGGWVLVGRGRQGWKAYYAGLGTPAQVRNTITGTAAFAPAQLPSTTIDGLLAGGKVSDLADGIRLRRATDRTGTAWQEARFKMANRTRWAWTFGALHAVGSYSFDGVSGTGGQTVNFGSDQLYRRVNTQSPANQGYLWGFAYGTSVTGSASSSSYIWSKTENAGSGRPFTQMFLRPKTTRDALYTSTVSNAGTAKQELRALPESDAQKTTWGVTGLANGLNTELNTEVESFAQVGQTVFVSGNFATVQKDAAGTGKVAQSYLAGFDVDTSQLVTTFRPTFNNAVRAVVGLPDGRLAAAGPFTTVNGVAQAGLALLDPKTGALSGPQVSVENRGASGVINVRNLDTRGNYLYLAGQFTHLVQGTVVASAWDGGRVNLTTGRPDTSWNPNLNGTATGVSASARGDRVYYSGYFSTVQSQTAPRVSAVGQASGAPMALPGWTPWFSTTTSSNWQNDVQEVGDRFYYGGSQHGLFGYDRNSLVRQSGSITLAGGDIQTIAATSDAATLFAGCHCGDFNYQDAYTWGNPGTTWTQADSINTFGAWDAASGAFLPDFNPIVKGRKGYGAWATFVDSRGYLWVGGDYATSIRAGYVNQWTGGYVRYAPRDNVAPTTPTKLAADSGTLKSFTLSWSPSTDAAGAPTYEVIEGNRVIATTSQTSVSVDRLDGTQRYFVRAVDAAGNRSASTPVLEVTAPTAPAPPAAPVASAETLSATSVRLTWPTTQADHFTVSRDGVEVASLPSGTTEYTDTGLSASTTYTYRVSAVDTVGQQTASAPVSATTKSQTTYVAANSSWRWRYDATAPAADWASTGFDDSTWSLGDGPLGFGTTLATTDISVGAPSPRPISAQYRTSFDVPDVSKLGTVTLTYVADDGAVVYVNGQEVSRTNLGTGAIAWNTFATAAPRSTTANANEVTLTIPASALVNGTNVVAAETHLNFRSTPDSLFRLGLTSSS